MHTIGIIFLFLSIMCMFSSALMFIMVVIDSGHHPKNQMFNWTLFGNDAFMVSYRIMQIGIISIVMATLFLKIFA